MNCDRTFEIIAKSGNCTVDWAKSLLSAARKAVCGKGVFCRDALAQLHKIVQDITDGRAHAEDMELIQEICSTMREAAECDISVKVAEAIAASIEESREEWEAHIKRKKCPGLVCNALVTFHILGDKCTGCTECLPKCPEKAIAGGQGLIHVIDQDRCTQCGVCFTVCSGISSAIVKAGVVKPQTPESPVPVGSFQAKAAGLGGLGLKKGLGLRNKLNEQG